MNNFEKGAIGYQGFGFVFADPMKTDIPFVFGQGSSKICGAGSFANFHFDLVSGEFYKQNKFPKVDLRYDILLGGSVKTLVPTLTLGGYETFFYSWIFVKTPDGKQFPATYYHGTSGTAIGGWDPENMWVFDNINIEELFPKDFYSEINFWPVDFSIEELKDLIAALELGLSRVPVSDFHCIYKHDLGNTLMAIVNGNPCLAEFGNNYTENDIQNKLDYWKRRYKKPSEEINYGALKKLGIDNYNEYVKKQIEMEIAMENDFLDDDELDKVLLEPEEDEAKEYAQEELDAFFNYSPKTKSRKKE